MVFPISFQNLDRYVWYGELSVKTHNEAVDKNRLNAPETKAFQKMLETDTANALKKASQWATIFTAFCK